MKKQTICYLQCKELVGFSELGLKNLNGLKYLDSKQANLLMELVMMLMLTLAK